MALLLGAMTIQGLAPGSAMLTKHLDVTYTMIWSLALANIMGTAICLAFTNQLAKVALIRIHLLAPLVIAVVFLASFQASVHYGDMWSLLFFSVVGWFMKRFAWPRPPIILGLVLSKLIENYLYISVSRYGAAWLLRPIVIIIALLTAASLFYGFRMMGRSGDAAKKTSIGFKFNFASLFTLLFFVLFALAVFTARDWQIQARLFPWVVGIPVLALCAIQLFKDLFVVKEDAGEDEPLGFMDLPVDRSVPVSMVIKRALNIFAWILGLFGAIWLIGFIVSVPLFVLLYLILQAREKIWVAVVYSIAMLAFIIGVFHVILSIPWPEGVFPQLEQLILQWF
jgi:hypothetical protein